MTRPPQDDAPAGTAIAMRCFICGGIYLTGDGRCPRCGTYGSSAEAPAAGAASERETVEQAARREGFSVMPGDQVVMIPGCDIRAVATDSFRAGAAWDRREVERAIEEMDKDFEKLMADGIRTIGPRKALRTLRERLRREP